MLRIILAIGLMCALVQAGVQPTNGSGGETLTGGSIITWVHVDGMLVAEIDGEIKILFWNVLGGQFDGDGISIEFDYDPDPTNNDTAVNTAGGSQFGNTGAFSS